MLKNPAPGLFTSAVSQLVTPVTSYAAEPGVQAAAEGGLAPVSIPSLLLMGTIPEKMVVFILVKEFFDWLHPQRPTSAVPPIAMTQAFNDPLEAHLDGVGTVTFVDACQLVGFKPFPFELAK